MRFEMKCCFRSQICMKMFVSAAYAVTVYEQVKSKGGICSDLSFHNISAMITLLYG